LRIEPKKILMCVREQICLRASEILQQDKFAVQESSVKFEIVEFSSAVAKPAGRVQGSARTGRGYRRSAGFEAE